MSQPIGQAVVKLKKSPISNFKISFEALLIDKGYT